MGHILLDHSVHPYIKAEHGCSVHSFGIGFPNSGSENCVSADVLIETDDLSARSLIHPSERLFRGRAALPPGRIHHSSLEIGDYRIVKSP